VATRRGKKDNERILQFDSRTRPSGDPYCKCVIRICTLSHALHYVHVQHTKPKCTRTIKALLLALSCNTRFKINCWKTYLMLVSYLHLIREIRDMTKAKGSWSLNFRSIISFLRERLGTTIVSISFCIFDWQIVCASRMHERHRNVTRRRKRNERIPTSRMSTHSVIHIYLLFRPGSSWTVQ